jgi:hypothetical protein
VPQAQHLPLLLLLPLLLFARHLMMRGSLWLRF